MAHESMVSEEAGRRDPRAVIVLMQGALPSMTRSDRAIADVLLSYPTAPVERLSIGDVAIRAGISESAVVKFAQRLGYTGFRALRRDLEAYAQLGNVDLHEELSDSDDAPTVVRKVFSTAVQAIQDTHAILHMPTFDRACSSIAAAKRVLVFGLGGSGIIGDDFEHKMLRIGRHIRSYRDAHMMAMAAALLDRGDVAIAITHSGTSAAVVEALQIARERRATTIALTNVPKSPIAHAARIVLLSASRGSPITGENAASRIAQLNILDAIFVRVSQSDRTASLDSLSRTMGSVARKRYRV